MHYAREYHVSYNGDWTGPATVSWTEADGTERRVELPAEVLRALLSRGLRQEDVLLWTCAACRDRASADSLVALVRGIAGVVDRVFGASVTVRKLYEPPLGGQ